MEPSACLAKSMSEYLRSELQRECRVPCGDADAATPGCGAWTPALCPRNCIGTRGICICPFDCAIVRFD